MTEEKKLGKAGLHFTVTQKGIDFVKGLEAIAEKHGVPKEKIPETLAHLAEYERIKIHGGPFDHLPKELQEILKKSLDTHEKRSTEVEE